MSRATSATRPVSGRVTGTLTGVELFPTRSENPLIVDLLRGATSLAPFYAGHPTDARAYGRKAEEVATRMPAADRERLRAAYRPTSPVAAAKLERVLAGEGIAVTTGQQAGLFGGPLYTVFKILSAVRLAEAVEQRLGLPALAVFWVGSHDHDWIEVNHTSTIDAEGRLRRIEVAGEVDPAVPMFDRVTGPPIERAVDELVKLLPATAFTPALVELLRSAYRPERTMAAAFKDLICGLLEGFDLSIFDPAHPSVWPVIGSVIAREIENAEAHTALLDATTKRLARAGYSPQVTIAPDASNAFLHDETGRDRLMREDGGWVLRRSKRTLGDAELRDLIRSEPQRFTPNVLLRPVVESTLIPTVAYVGGPAEVTYFAQIGCLFEAHGVKPPVVVPRHGASIIDARVRRVLDKFSLEPDAFRTPLHGLTTEVVRESLPVAVTAPVESLSVTIEREFETLIDGAAAVDPTLRDWAAGLRNRMLAEIRAADRKITAHLKKRSRVEVDQLKRAAASLYPDGSPQERVLSIVPMIAKYGRGLLDDVAEIMEHRLDGEMPGWSGVVCEDTVASTDLHPESGPE